MGKGLGFMSRGLAIAIIATCAVVAPLAGIAAAGQGGGSGDTEALATLKVENPSVQVKKAGAQKFKDAKDGQQLREGDTVKTDATGKAEIDYSDDAYTRLDVNTTFTVVSLTDDQGNRQIKGSLESGQTWNRTVALTESESYEQEGGGATAAVAGTAFAVECETVGHCDFTAVVDITTLTGVDGVQKLLSPLDQCDATSGVLCGDITQISVDDLPDWITQNLLRDLIERGLDDGGLRGTVVIEDDGTVNFVPAPPPPPTVEGEVVETPEEPPVDNSTAPSAPGGVSALPGWESATVAWTPGADGGAPVESYVVTASPGGQQCTVAPPATSCTVSGLSNDVLYTFSVTATNAKGTSPVSAASNEVLPPVVVPFGTECGPGAGQLDCSVYRYTLSDPGPGFSTPGFDDSSWQQGNAPFGENVDGCEGFGTPSSPFPLEGEVWVRIEFELAEGGSIEIVGTVDNVAEFFVDGEFVREESAGDCAVETIQFVVADLAPGTHVLAVRLEDDTDITGDVSYFDVEVRVANPSVSETATTQTAPEPDEVATTTTSSTEPTTTTTEPTTTTTEPTTTTTALPTE